MHSKISHPLDRSAAFTALLQFCPGFGRTEGRQAEAVVTRFLDGFYASGSTDMAAYAKIWAMTASPIETEAQARELPSVRAAHDTFRADPGAGRMAPRNDRLLCDAASAAGVDLGADDHRILLCLAGPSLRSTTWSPRSSAAPQRPGERDQ